MKCNATPEREKKSRKTQLVVESFALLLLVVPPVKRLDIFLSVFLFPEIKKHLRRQRRRRRRPHEREEREDALEAEEKRGGF